MVTQQKTSFIDFLISKGYLCFTLDTKTMKYKKGYASTNGLSTLGNLDIRFIPSTDTKFLSFIEQGKSVMDKDFDSEVRASEIIYGLHQVGKPPTLIYPRPRIKYKTDNGLVKDDFWDDSMNVVLQKIPNEAIFEAMYDKSILIEA